MAERRTTRSRARTAEAGDTDTQIPRDIYAEMLAEAGVVRSEEVERAPKRRRARRSQDGSNRIEASATRREAAVAKAFQMDHEDEEEGVEFEDVEIPKPTIQTVYMESDEEEDSEDDDGGLVFEDIDFNVPTPDEKAPNDPEKTMELNLSAQKAAMTPTRGRAGAKKKPLSKDEKALRVQVHKEHLLCLLYHCTMRNRWCNDAKVQKCLKSLLTQRMANYLNPSRNLSQFGQTEALKNGLQEVGRMFRLKYQITERGLRRALWAEDVEDLSKYEPPPDLETCLDKADFLEAARTLRGSRDVGAQLYCALLRAAGMQARLVCSLQPLPFLAGGPTLPKPREPRTPAKKPTVSVSKLETTKDKGPEEGPSSASPRRRPAFQTIPSHFRRPVPKPQGSKQSHSAPRQIKESAFPIYWVEVLDVAHQKWQPADPLVTNTSWRTRVFEPPLADRENSMAYVIALGADGTVRDVTRRYTKAYTAKTRRLRVESADDRGDEWWRAALRRYTRRGYPTDLEQIEDNELAAALAREPIPKSIADFKGHPLYVLERHLRRNEVLLEGAKDVGTVGAGPRAALERVYLRRSVRVARSRDKWYRMGRTVRFNEIPVKWLPPRRRGADEDEDGESARQDEVGTPLFLEEQTEVFRHPPVVDGVVPRNKFGNLDLYVPSMVPEGGAYVDDELAARAAFILGISYVPALTGFHFKGRHGTAVLRGVVIPAEAEEGVRSVIAGLRDVEAEMAEERRRRECLRVWRRLLMGLRIRAQIWAGVDEGAEATDADADGGESGKGKGKEVEMEREEDFERAVEEAASDVSEEYVIEEDDGFGGGGFLVE
ncbi:related to xeroderma pigmentosum group C complementing factor [Cephalotrichum gorgonifer]|uniref:Related to xeroderma pigmentosum group C complementing factor n=1 Tax=Cephalotrichum gorgonifer TaxID=2041049 RepID=A0AAE8SS77_9PEZI|nr:related to xeroderma pigmentosum group C complementing factor [Cephalotrichum gorgonifer]